MKVKLSDWASIAEIIGAAAIVISLVFVGLEIRDSGRQTELNTQALQMGAYQALVGQISDISKMLIDYPEVNDLMRGPSENIPDGIMGQVINIDVMAIRHGDLAFCMYELGMLSEERLQSSIGVLRSLWCTPMFSTVWGAMGPTAVPAYRDFVETNISESC